MWEGLAQSALKAQMRPIFGPIMLDNVHPDVFSEGGWEGGCHSVSEGPGGSDLYGPFQSGFRLEKTLVVVLLTFDGLGTGVVQPSPLS